MAEAGKDAAGPFGFSKRERTDKLRLYTYRLFLLAFAAMEVLKPGKHDAAGPFLYYMRGRSVELTDWK
jgi:hypothetical protein